MICAAKSRDTTDAPNSVTMIAIDTTTLKPKQALFAGYYHTLHKPPLTFHSKARSPSLNVYVAGSHRSYFCGKTNIHPKQQQNWSLNFELKMWG